MSVNKNVLKASLNKAFPSSLSNEERKEEKKGNTKEKKPKQNNNNDDTLVTGYRISHLKVVQPSPKLNGFFVCLLLFFLFFFIIIIYRHRFVNLSYYKSNIW